MPKYSYLKIPKNEVRLSMSNVNFLKRSLIFLAFFSAACSNTKDTRVSRAYHNLTSHYNGYYHARLKIKDGVDQLAALHIDRYDRILKMYRYADAEKAKTIYPIMDEAIKKLGTVITRHTIIDKYGNEKPDSEKWIDDNWLVYGQAEFYKHDYFAALETFEFVEGTYRNSPTRHLASLWIVKTYLELTQLNEAESKLDYLRNQKDFPRKSLGELEAVSADFYLQTRNYPKAIIHLTRAAELARERQDRIRFQFILGQVYQKQNDCKRAFETYTNAIRMNPPYEMEFNARINRARCYLPGMKEGLDIRTELLKMERDPKNLEYLDQVYYALASISLKEKDEPKALDYLKKSIMASQGNTSQKAQTFLELGRIYLEKPEYRMAQAYYDSCITYISQDHPDYESVVNRRNSLTRLVRFLNTIQREDSLMRMAGMSEAELNSALEGIVTKEDEAKAAAEAQAKEAPVEQIFNKPGTPQATTGSWYFYNPSAMAFGLNEFTRKWGNRKLEDNWRRSQKEQTFQLPDEAEIRSAKPAGDSVAAVSPEQAREARLRELKESLPLSPEEVEKSKNKIIEAYYNAALIYKDQLTDAKAAINMFEELIRRFPGNKYEVQSCYQLYKLHAQVGNTTQSEFYKNKILTEHAETEYAKMILNPNYGIEMANQKSQLDIFYEETYRKFLNSEYNTVIARRDEAAKQFPENALMPKFDLLRSLSIGRTNSVAAFESSLQDLIRNYADDPVKDKAQEMLDYIQALSGTKAEELETALSKDTVIVQKYTYKPDTTHFLFIVFPIAGMNASSLQKKVSDFNNVNFSTKEYNTTNLVIDNKNQAILVRSFPNKAEVQSYSTMLYDNDEVYGNLNPDAYQHIIISVQNYVTLMKDRKLSEYMDFYNRFYK